MKTWASLKASMDEIGHEVRQVLLVRSDLGMLQEDLRTQEDLWHKAEADLQQELDALAARARRLKEKVDEGAHIKEDVRTLRAKIQAQQDEAYRTKLDFEHARTEAELEEQRLRARAQDLEQQLAAAEAAETKEVEAARHVELEAKEATAALERELAQLKDRMADEEASQELAQRTAAAKTRGLKGELADSRAALARMRSQVMPKSQVEAQVKAMQEQLKQETQQMVQVQTAHVQLAAACKQRLQVAEEALDAERRKAAVRRQEMLPVCNAARQQHELLRAMLAKSCGEQLAAASDASPAPAPAADPTPAAGAARGATAPASLGGMY